MGSNRAWGSLHEVGAVEERMRRSVEEHVEEEPYQVEETKYMNE